MLDLSISPSPIAEPPPCILAVGLPPIPPQPVAPPPSAVEAKPIVAPRPGGALTPLEPLGSLATMSSNEIPLSFSRELSTLTVAFKPISGITACGN